MERINYKEVRDKIEARELCTPSQVVQKTTE
jgi:hypothetical protein